MGDERYDARPRPPARPFFLVCFVLCFRECLYMMYFLCLRLREIYSIRSLVHGKIPYIYH